MSISRSRRRRNGVFVTCWATAATLLTQQYAVYGFTSTGWHRPSCIKSPHNSARAPQSHLVAPQARASASSTSLNMFMGSDGGILGIGGPELVSPIEMMLLTLFKLQRSAIGSLFQSNLFCVVHHFAGWIFCSRTIRSVQGR
jgi:hypothetical protein